MSRIEALAAALEAPLLVTDPVNLRYLCGFASSNAALLVAPDGEATLYTDFRYLEAARSVPGVGVEQTARALLASLAERLEGTIGFEPDRVSVTEFELLRAGGLTLVAVRGAVEALRAVKDADEIALLRRASRAAERAFEALTAETWVGHSERELAWRFQQLAHAHGADGLAFETIIAAGPRGALPHAVPSDELVETRTLVTADFGVRIDGYCSDCTRTLSTGELPHELREAYALCLEAQLTAVNEIRPGMTGAEADATARAVIDAGRQGDRFGHGLGHGVGLAVHEGPRLTPESREILEPGNVVTIEPGIYIPGVGGVRIEDLALVTEDGVELLTAFPKEVVVVT